MKVSETSHRAGLFDRAWIVILSEALLTPVLWWANWIRGQAVVRSRHGYYTVVIHKAPQQRYRFNLIDYLVDSSEMRSTLMYSFAVYLKYESTPITSFSTTDAAFDPWKTAKVKWLSSQHFIISLDDMDTFGCRFDRLGGIATWYRVQRDKTFM